MKVDLHCHSNLSDGQLSPLELVQYAGEQGIQKLAITDHDRAEEMPEVARVAQSLGVELIPGIELSSQWSKISVHVVGLNISLGSKAVEEITSQQTRTREQRAIKIGERLAQKNIHGSLEGAKRIAGDSQIGRPHFAQYLVETGKVKDLKSAYKKYLGTGKVGDVKSQWPELERVVEWIHQAGGQAILAHPSKYKLTRRKLDLLCDVFKDAGGDGLEIVSGMQTKDITEHHQQLCEKFEFLASCGSDFHGPVSSWHDLGKMSEMPKSCKPVWELWA